VDKATLEMLAKAKADKVSTVFDRAEEMKPCPIGVERELL
jgi:carbon-monoxide dehydrogenase catalytic subunit